MQTFGDLQNFNPHLHMIATDGCFSGHGTFHVGKALSPQDLEYVFRHEVLKMLKSEGKIGDAVIENMLSWHHSGFNVYCGPAIWPHDKDAIENLARYIVRAPFSQERMTYIPSCQSEDAVSKVIYHSKDGTCSKTFDALEWLDQLTTHIPDRQEQTVRYDVYYNNNSRGMRIKAGKDDIAPVIDEPEISEKSFRKNWARLIQKIYETDPLICPKCKGEMKVIAFIEQQSVIRKMLTHLGIWKTRNHDPPATNNAAYQIVYDEEYPQSLRMMAGFDRAY